MVRAACPHDCPDTCAMRITVEDGRVQRVEGEPEHPPTAGVLRTKVSRYAERTYHPERLLHPLKRIGPKGSGQWETVSWDSALADIAARLGEIASRGPERILPYSYSGTMGHIQGESIAARFFHALGASQLDRTVCSSAGSQALAATYGGKLGMHLGDFAHAKLILIWGSNSITSNLHFWRIAQEAKRQGATLVCIDPRRTETAEKCQRHLAIRPGTDGALALALMHELFAKGWTDSAYMDAHVNGWEKLRDRAVDWTPERAAAVCGVPAEEIRWLAEAYAQTRPAAIRLNYGMQRVAGGGNAVRLVALLPCLTGAWRERGGGVLLSASGWAAGVIDAAALERPDLMPSPAPRTINMSAIGDALNQPGDAAFGPRVEALVVYNSNPVAIAPDSLSVIRGLQREDILTVVLEHFLTDTADLADYVLPATMQLEHLDLHSSYGHTWLLLNEPAIAPPGEARSNTSIFRELARRMGMLDPLLQESDESLLRTALAGGPVSVEELGKTGWVRLPVPELPFADGGFRTPDGKAIVDSPLYGVPDYVPNRESVSEAPSLAAKFPLAMISPPARHFLNSSFVNVKSLRAIEGEPLLEIHAEDAASRGIADGERVRLFNERGSYTCRAEVSERARPGVVNALGVWWRKLNADGSGVNDLTGQALTDIGRGATFDDCLVEVERVAASG
ncbi:MAG: molybdopterin-dependent oxidoreductase [Gammaproteobacteria bacterium]